MKALTLCFFFLLISILASSQIPENADSIIKQNNIIKEMIVTYRFKKKLSEDSVRLTFEMLYNDQGKKTALKIVYKGVPRFIESFDYDNKNTLVKAFFYGNENKIINTEVYEYDSLGRQVGSHSSGLKGTEPPNDTIKTQGKVRKIYNGKNQLLELFYTLKADSILNKSEQYAYTNDGKIDKSFYFTQDGELYLSYNYVYKKNGDIIVFQRFKLDQFGKAYEKFYNKQKQLVKVVDYHGKGIITKYLYNVDGTLLDKYEIYGEGFTMLERHFYTKE